MTVEIASSPADSPPFPVELIVLEEDRWLVLSTDNRIRPVRQPVEVLIEDMQQDVPPDRGTVLVRGNRLLAIVHDLDQQPSTTPDIVRASLNRVFEYCEQHGVRTIAMQMIGHHHGHLTRADFIQLLGGIDKGSVNRIWLLEQPGKP